MQLSPFPCHLVPLRSKYSPQHPILLIKNCFLIIVTIRVKTCQPTNRLSSLTCYVVFLFHLQFEENKYKKVKFTLVQALRLCTGRTAHRGSRGLALTFHDQRHYKGVRNQRHAPAAIYPRVRPGARCTGCWVGPETGLDRCGKSCFHWDSIPGPSSSYPVAIPNWATRPTM
jgi:hypothetical protein